jgi:hypothetical protein
MHGTLNVKLEIYFMYKKEEKIILRTNNLS